ncbi:MAG: hypothetical protein NWQ17_09935 [Polaribacter sp.]|nr:hypothetical protein [Polaribacter sp.]
MKGLKLTFNSLDFPKILVDENFFEIKSDFNFKSRKFNFSDVETINHQIFESKGVLEVKMKNGKQYSYKTSSKPNEYFENTLELIKTEIDPNYKMNVYIAPEHDNNEELHQIELDFNEFTMLNLNLPEISFNLIKGESLVIEIDLEFEVDNNGKPKDIKLSKQRNLIPRTSNTNKELIKTDSEDFFKNAVELIESFKEWKPYTFKGIYVKKSFLKTIYFTYHSRYFINEKPYVLNPYLKASFEKQDDLYQRIIKCKYGCDGKINVCSLVDINGKLKEINIIGQSGKICSEMAISELKKLEPLKPAFENNDPVESQLDIMVYI